MPITVPGISVTAATDLLVRQDAALKQIPEVASVFGKAGRYETSTDPSPLSMIEATIRLRPRDEWRPGLTEETLVADLDRAVAVPGLNRAWTKPVRGRIDMLSTGIRTQVGIKIFGRDLTAIEGVGRQLEGSLAGVPGTRSAYAERIGGGSYVDFEPDRAVLQRYGMTVGDAQMVVETAIGGMEISETVEGRERYTIAVRYPRELRDDVEKLGRVMVPTPTGAQVPLGELGRIVSRTGPPMILDENGSIAGYVYVDLEGRDTGGYVADAKSAVAKELGLPPGTLLALTGQYEYLARMQARMKLILPPAIVDRRLLEEIERNILTPEARKFTLERAAEIVNGSVRDRGDRLPAVEAELVRTRREIDNLLRALETGKAPASVLDRLTEKEKVAAALDSEIRSLKATTRVSTLDLRRIDRLLEDQLSRFSEVIREDHVRGRQALAKLLVRRIQFTPTELPRGERTYTLEAEVTLGKIAASTAACSKVYVPDGI